MRTRTKRPARMLAVVVMLGTGYLYAQSRRGADPGVESGLRSVVESPLLAGRALLGRGADRLGEIFRREGLRERVRDLEATLATTRLENARLAELLRERTRLGQIAGLREEAFSSTVAARVIATDRGEALGSILIDRGSVDGVRLDSAVVAADGLVGRVIKVGDRTAVVQLVAAASSAVGVLDERSTVQGVLYGTGSERCVLRYVPNLEDVAVGDSILASGLDQIYPKGVVVGVVSEVKPGPDAFRVIHVTPAVGFRRLETVLVVLTVRDEGQLASVVVAP